MFGLAIMTDTLRYSCKDTVKYTTAFGSIYFGSRLLNIVAFRNAAFVATLQLYRFDCHKPIAYGLSSPTISFSPNCTQDHCSQAGSRRFKAMQT